ncbi:hypothetical protein ZWY2020_020769 [Hordeum vulgare]|nr:hypothetical protein ZWY2020_020769 [Hordeum vulgare]
MAAAARSAVDTAHATPTPRAEIRPVQLFDEEIRRLCTSHQDVFLSQPNLLELEAPIKVCGKGARFLPNPPPRARLQEEAGGGAPAQGGGEEEQGAMLTLSSVVPLF